MKTVEESCVPNNLNIEEMQMKPRVGNYITTILICLALVAVGVYFVISISDPIERWVIGGGLVLVSIYIFLISMIGQRASAYKIEFSKGEGLRNFKLFYNGEEIEIEYKLDKCGRFMWADYKSKAKCIRRKGKEKDGLWFDNFTKYRIMNFINGFLTQNNLMSKNAY